MDKFLVEIPFDAFIRCLSKLEERSSEYRLLRNAIVLNANTRNAIVHLRCDSPDAKLIQRILIRECPEFLDQVHCYPDRPQSF